MECKVFRVESYDESGYSFLVVKISPTSELEKFVLSDYLSDRKIDEFRKSNGSVFLFNVLGADFLVKNPLFWEESWLQMAHMFIVKNFDKIESGATLRMHVDLTELIDGEDISGGGNSDISNLN